MKPNIMNLKEKTKIAIAEDHKLLRNAYLTILSERGDYEVVIEVSNGKELLDAMRTNLPDVVLLDLEMPVMKGGTAFEKIKVQYPGVKTIIISAYFNDSFVTEYFLRGVNGYLSKDSDPEQLFEAIDSVMTDHFYFNRSVSLFLLQKIMKDKEQKIAIDKLNLTPVEVEILKMICDEKTTKTIAEKIGISVYSVDNHRRNIQEKTQQSSVIGLFKFALKHGITEAI